MSARRNQAASIAALSLSLSLSLSLALSTEGRAQAWIAGYNHTIAAPAATDFLAPFPNAVMGGSQIVLPPPLVPFFIQPGQPGGLYGWSSFNPPGTFNAIHMSVIPKGPYRGQVVVWDRYPVVLKPGAPFDATNYWACQAWAIVNPDPNAPAPRFRNFLLPMQNLGATPPDLATIDLEDLFCTGHAWSPFGDLVVAGGAKYRFTFGPFTIGGITFPLWPAPNIEEDGARFVYMWDPAQQTAPFPGQTGVLYPGQYGRWQKPQPPHDQLVLDRYYPTVMLTHRLDRLNNLLETMVVSGGIDLSMPVPLPTNPGGANDPRNTYESFVVRESTTPLPLNFLAIDLDPLFSQRLFFGPGATSDVDHDWLSEYPRHHLLSNGRWFLSGWAPVSASVDPEYPWPFFPPPAVGNGSFDRTIGTLAPNGWNQVRHDGTSLFFARYGGSTDLVVRLGGISDNGVTTSTAEYCLATALPPSGQTTPWVALGTMPGAGGRTHTNAVILPDGSILVVGGDDLNGGAELEVAEYRSSTQWSSSVKTPTMRLYHATMVLLPSGRVFVGGGEGRNRVTTDTPTPHDYDLFEPAYLQGTQRPGEITLDPTVSAEVDAWDQTTYVLSPGQADIEVAGTMEGLAFYDKVVLMAPGSITHHSDMSARYIELESVATSTKSRQFNVPDETVAPRGYYMLFVLSNGGVPSEAIWVRIE